MDDNKEKSNKYEDVIKAIEETLKSIRALKDDGGNE